MANLGVDLSRRDFLRCAAAGAAAAAIPRRSFASPSADVKIKFAMHSDYHFGVSKNENTGVLSYNSEYDVYVETINKLLPDFLVLCGDNINENSNGAWNGTARDYVKCQEVYLGLTEFLKKMDSGVKVFPVIGNHEYFVPDKSNNGGWGKMTTYLQDPRYYVDHLDLVETMAGSEYRSLYYSWDLGGWHFISYPCGEVPFLKAIGLFTWFEADLNANKGKPTVIFMHPTPIGVGIADGYFIDQEHRALFFPLVEQHGNVKYCFAGHIHNGTKVAVRSARTYKGTTYFTGPTHVSDRPFGRGQHYAEEEAQNNSGYMVCEIDTDDNVTLYSLLPDMSKIQYPDTFEEITYEDNPVNFHTIFDVRAVAGAANLSFASGFSGWYKSYEYIEDVSPSYVRELSTEKSPDGSSRAHVCLKGRAQVDLDTTRVPMGNALYRVFPLHGKPQDFKFTARYNVAKMVWADTDLSRYESQVTTWRLTRFMRDWDYNLGFIHVSFFDGSEVLQETELFFGRWEPGYKNTEPDLALIGVTQLLSRGLYTYRRPDDSVRTIASAETGKWHSHELTFGGRPNSARAFNKVLVIYSLVNDGLTGHEMDAMFTGKLSAVSPVGISPPTGLTVSR